MSGPGHEQHDQDVGAYLLGSLSELETTAFKRHLMRCEECANDLEALAPAVDALRRSVEPVEPPPGLKAGLMEIVRREATAPARTQASQRERRGLAWPPRLRLAAAGLVATALLAVGVALGYGFGALDRGQDRAGVRTLVAEVDRSRLSRGSARLVVPREGGGDPILAVEGLEQPPENRVYQVWLLRGERPVPAGLLAVEADGTGRTAITGDVEGAEAVLMTREREGGAPAPTEIPLMRIPLT